MKKRLMLALSLVALNGSLVAMKLMPWEEVGVTEQEYKEMQRKYEQYEKEHQKKQEAKKKTEKKPVKTLQEEIEELRRDGKYSDEAVLQLACKHSKQHEENMNTFNGQGLTPKEAMKLAKQESCKDITVRCLEKNCAICIDDFEDETEVGVLKKCLHGFCANCVKEQSKTCSHDDKTPFCPICRMQFQNQDIVCGKYKNLKVDNKYLAKQLDDERKKVATRNNQILQDQRVAQELESEERGGNIFGLLMQFIRERQRPQNNANDPRSAFINGRFEQLEDIDNNN